MCDQEKAKYYLVGTRLRMAFQMNNWTFLGYCSSQIQFYGGFLLGTFFVWYRYFKAELTEQIPLLWGHTKESEILVNCAT